jgi:hypothetical protein
MLSGSQVSLGARYEGSKYVGGEARCVCVGVRSEVRRGEGVCVSACGGEEGIRAGVCAEGRGLVRRCSEEKGANVHTINNITNRYKHQNIVSHTLPHSFN